MVCDKVTYAKIPMQRAYRNLLSSLKWMQIQIIRATAHAQALVEWVRYHAWLAALYLEQEDQSYKETAANIPIRPIFFLL